MLLAVSPDDSSAFRWVLEISSEKSPIKSITAARRCSMRVNLVIFSSIFVDFVVVGVSPFHMHFRPTFEGESWETKTWTWSKWISRPEAHFSIATHPRWAKSIGRRIFRRSKPAIFQNGAMKSSEPPLSFHALDARFFFGFGGGTCVFMVGSLDSEMIFGIENSNSFPVTISS